MAINTGMKDTGILWHTPDQEPFSLQGFAFNDENTHYCRLPASIKPLLEQERPQLLELMRHTAGGALRFSTDSREIRIRAELDGPAYMSHMTPAGQCGFDCYLRSPGQSDWFMAGVTKFPIHNRSYECCIFSQPESRLWEVMIYFPLYIGMNKIEVGIRDKAEIKRCSEFTQTGSIAVHGTSITQGGCASRPGMTYPAILGRLLDCEIYNFGFSGNGVANPCLASEIASISDLRLLIVDIEENAGPDNLLKKNLPAFLDIVRKAKPHLPVLVLSGASMPRERWDMEYLQKKISWSEFQRSEIMRRRENGDIRMHFIDGRQIDLEDATVDGIHLTDLGFHKIANALALAIRQLG